MDGTSPASPAGARERPTCTCGLCDSSGNIDWSSPAIRARMVAAIKRDYATELLRHARRGGKYVVAGSAALYVVGFCICVLHYYRRGVPVHALTHTQFIAAGVLFLTLTVGAHLFGVSSAALVGIRGLNRILLSTAVLVTFAVTQLGVRGAAGIAGYWFYTAFLAWCTTAALLRPRGLANLASRRESDAQSDRFHVMAPIANPVAQFLFAVVLFTTVMFPAIPQWLGGGDARRASVLWSTPLTDAEKKSVGVADECVFEVHSESSHLYLMFLDPADGRCSEGTGGERGTLAGVGTPNSNRRYMVVARERVASVVYR